MPNASVDIEISMHKSISTQEHKEKELIVYMAPSILFKMPKQPAQQKQVPQATPKETGAVNPAPKPQIKKVSQQPIPTIYVLTKEESEMFWGTEVLDFFKGSSSLVLDMAKKRGVPPQNGVQEMHDIVIQKYDQLVESVQSGSIEIEDYKNMLINAIKRENSRLPNIPPEFRNEHIGLIQTMKNELESFEE